MDTTHDFLLKNLAYGNLGNCIVEYALSASSIVLIVLVVVEEGLKKYKLGVHPQLSGNFRQPFLKNLVDLYRILGIGI